eukprot:TRINITY_DN1642_c0_g1_i1.p1 TRINITY_DN1642_c0_g1~~TRINITY_DN1642_c0_g1_i1.p1  ORF type:complete len:348 (+),score=67.93 TRINITY_DN1642_c0_g1_i1:92-1135(+)
MSLSDLQTAYVVQQKQFLENINKVIEIESTRLNKDRDAFEIEKKEWDKLKGKPEKIEQTKIKLDVGGRIFATSLTTLTSQPGSYFEAMFSGRWQAKMSDDGTYFIDRDPAVFRHIMNFLRTGGLKFDKLKDDEKKLLVEDADFYQLYDLIDLLKFAEKTSKEIVETAPTTGGTPILLTDSHKFLPGPNYTLSADGKLITHSGKDSLWGTTVIGPRVNVDNTSKQEFVLSIENAKYKVYSNIMIGIGPKSLDQNATCNYVKAGWYLYTNGFTLYSGYGDSAKNYQPSWNKWGGTGTVIKVVYDNATKELSFVVNDTSGGVAWSGISMDEPLHLIVLLNNDTDQVRLIN